ncbi:MAG TPA: RNA polymerase sigma factor, partial [Candidatus Acidoferrum sp.]|nr:RNA polymerase sigma factor [Candidatus Acidoferrum sp.]
MSDPDNQLIAEYDVSRGDDAFAALVRQHINLVFATAMRQVGDHGAAEEITQNVFVALAQASGKLKSHPTIAGWLHRTTLNKSREWFRSELRRHRREEIAVARELAATEGDSIWTPLVPLLDEALLRVHEPDRLAVIMHYMEGKTFQEVGSTLGIGEDTARKRVSRCLDQLTHFFRRRGFAAPALAASAPLFTLSSHAAPAGLAASVTSASLAAAHSAASASTLTLIKGALKVMAWTKTKTVIITGVAVLLAAGTGTIVYHAVSVARTTAGLTVMQGNWEGTLHAGPMNLRLVFKIFKTNDTFRATMDSIDQGAKDIPIPKISATPHSLDIVQPALDVAYHATLNADGTQLSGKFVQMKKTFRLTLIRTDTPDTVNEMTLDQVAPSASSDLQGAWEGTLAVGGTTLRLGLRIAEPSPGTFQAQMDSLDQGVRNMPVTSFTYQKPQVHFKMTSIDGDFVGDIDNADDRLTGTWKQMGQKWPLTFERVKTNTTAAATEQLDYGQGASYQVQGHWKGILSVKGLQLHIVFHIAQMPDGSYTATMDSPDQGAAGIPATTAECDFPNVKLTWKIFNGVFTGKMNNGKLSGTWSQ